MIVNGKTISFYFFQNVFENQASFNNAVFYAHPQFIEMC